MGLYQRRPISSWEGRASSPGSPLCEDEAHTLPLEMGVRTRLTHPSTPTPGTLDSVSTSLPRESLSLEAFRQTGEGEQCVGSQSLLHHAPLTPALEVSGLRFRGALQLLGAADQRKVSKPLAQRCSAEPARRRLPTGPGRLPADQPQMWAKRATSRPHRELSLCLDSPQGPRCELVRRTQLLAIAAPKHLSFDALDHFSQGLKLFLSSVCYKLPF